MGLIQNILSTTDSIPISTIQQKAMACTIASLSKLSPELPMDGSLFVHGRRWTQLFATRESAYRLSFECPSMNGDAFAFLSVHQANLTPVRSRLKEQDPTLARHYLLLESVSGGSTHRVEAQFTVAHRHLYLPRGRHQLVALIGVLVPGMPVRVGERLPLLVDLPHDQLEELDDAPPSSEGARQRILSLVVGLSLFVAFADGQYDTEEEAQIVRTLVDLENPSDEKRPQLSENLRRVARAFRFEKRVLDDMCAAARDTMGMEGRRMLLKVLLAVAAADGILDPNEEKLLQYVRGQLELPLELLEQQIDEFFTVRR